VARCHTAAFLDDNRALIIFNIENSDFTAQSFWIELKGETIFLLMEDTRIKEHTENLFRAVTKRAQQNSRWQFTATIDTHVENIFGIELKI
jgi:hypothetical protein